MTDRAHWSGQRPRNRRPARRRIPHVAVLAAVAGLSLAAAACGSSGPSTAATTTTQVKVNTATAPSDIATAYNTLFNLSNPDVNSKVAVIQNGSTITSALQQALSSSLASSAGGAKIDSTSLLSASKCATAKVPYPCAHVTYDINNTTGTAILPNSQGYAVYVDGKWLVAKTTICGLLGLFEQAEGSTQTPQGC